MPVVITGVEVAYHSLPDASSSVVHMIREAELVVLVATNPEMTGAVTSGIAGVVNEYSLDVALFPEASADTTK